MKFSVRSLAPVIGIPAGFLPLLAMVETGPAEVAATLFLLVAFGFLEAIGAGRAEHEARWPRWTWSAAKIAFAYGYCLVVGLSVAMIANAKVPPTRLQRWLFGEPGFHDLTPLSVRFFQLSLCAFTCWAAAMAMMSRRRSALWLALLATPVVIADFWHLFSIIGPAMFDGWYGLVLASLLAVGSVVLAVRRRPPRRSQLAPPVTTPPSDGPVETGLARPKQPIQFTLGAMLALTAICAAWSGLVVFSSRENRNPRGMKTVRVSGTVTFQRQPLANAHVVFQPREPTTGRAAQGTTNGSGEFELVTHAGGTMFLPGALKGDYFVMITNEAAGSSFGGMMPDMTGAMPSATPGSALPGMWIKGENEPDSAVPSATIPERYSDPRQSGLRATIVDDKWNRFTFDLQAEPEP